MRLTITQTGIISYAGLDKDALWAKAKRAFSQAEENVPERYTLFLPIFPIELVENMSYVGLTDGTRTRVSAAGFSISPTEYFRKLFESMPELFADDNQRRNFDYESKFKGGSVMTVDRTWAMRFPQYQPFAGERLVLHMIGGGHQAVAVPESVYPRGCGILSGTEIDMRITARVEHFTAYIRMRLKAGEKYDPVRLEENYLRQNNLLPVRVTQSELGRVMQDLCIIKTLQGEQSNAGLFTENAKRAEHILQYVPFHCACDTFESVPITRATARLIQLYFDGDDAVSDLWLPYPDASEYIDKQRLTLDVCALCEGFQIAPAFDPETLGGRYPDHVRMVVVRDRDLQLMVADTLNNPAYGSGMSPLGMLCKLVYLSDSKELLRQRKLALEKVSITCENTQISEICYERMVALATLQEHKGKLVDAMYRYVRALSQMQVGTQAYERARELLDMKIQTLTDMIARDLGEQQGGGQLSGYDADIDYLRRMRLDREGDLCGDNEREQMPFSTDPLRELSIESGYSMRNGVRCFGLSELYDDVEEAPIADEPADGASGEETSAIEVVGTADVHKTAEEENSKTIDDASGQEARVIEVVSTADVHKTAEEEKSKITQDGSSEEAAEKSAAGKPADGETVCDLDDETGNIVISSDVSSSDEPVAVSGEFTSKANANASSKTSKNKKKANAGAPHCSHPNPRPCTMADLSPTRAAPHAAVQTINKQGKMAQMLNQKKK